jgi:hypothetical protein
MQAILIMSPILVCAFLTGVLLAWVVFVTLPRMRRAEKDAPRKSRSALLNASIQSRSSTPSLVDADQQAVRRNA